MVGGATVPGHRHARRLMKGVVLVGAAIITSALTAMTVFPPSTYLLWNRTESAPKGLYWRSDSPLTRNGWAVVSGKAPAAIWISEHGYLQRDWPIIKRVRGMSGDLVCRESNVISISKIPVAEALISDRSGQKLPVWSGCFTLKDDEIFLLNDHPRSLDGRYFGITKRHDVTGSARLLISVE